MMRLEVVRLVTDALNDPTTGVNAQLPGVPRDADDAMPPNVNIYDETNDDFVIERLPPPKLPAIYVMLDGTITTTGQYLAGTYRETTRSVFVTLRYIVSNQDHVRGAADADYTMRAAVRAIAAMFYAGGQKTPVRNSIAILTLTSMSYIPARESVGDATVAGALVIEFNRVRDTAPFTGG